MSGQVEFCFDFVSPMSYFAFHRLKEVQSRTGCEVDYKPVWLFEVMKQSGNQPPGTIPAKRDFYFSDTVRHAKRYNLPWQWNSDFPLNTLHLLRMTEGLRGSERFESFIETCFHNMWGEPKKISDISIAKSFLAEAGFDVEALFALSEDAEAKLAVKANTQSAIDRGMFGAPTFFVNGELYFGQDRLDFVEDALTEKAWV